VGHSREENVLLSRRLNTPRSHGFVFRLKKGSKLIKLRSVIDIFNLRKVLGRKGSSDDTIRVDPIIRYI
jgi:hypothetical protein